VTQNNNQPFALNFAVRSPASNLSWEVTTDFTAYASYGRSFRRGVFAVGVTTPLDARFLTTPDEKSDGGEVGLNRPRESPSAW
jgi:iron complex outermembrane receptor protein